MAIDFNQSFNFVRVIWFKFHQNNVHPDFTNAFKRHKKVAAPSEDMKSPISRHDKPKNAGASA